MPPKVNQELENTIARIASESKVMALGLTVRQIQAMVKDKLGFEPATSTVATVLRRLGFDTSAQTKHQWHAGKK